MHGEKASADVYAADDWIESRLPEIKDMWAPRDIFNADETGVFFIVGCLTEDSSPMTKRKRKSLKKSTLLKSAWRVWQLCRSTCSQKGLTQLHLQFWQTWKMTVLQSVFKNQKSSLKSPIISSNIQTTRPLLAGLRKYSNLSQLR